ncbi:MAG: hypothetical protein JNN03_10670 [Rubrivivax sp.]|nr:hypothetical protein [Rubrivivax sp.]
MPCTSLAAVTPRRARGRSARALACIAVALCALGPWISAVAAPLRDPRAPVGVDAPEGWRLEHANGVSSLIGGGGAFVSWMRIPGAGADPGRVRPIVDQMLAQLRKAQPRGQGVGALGGRPAQALVAQGVDPRGAEVSVRYLWAGFGPDAWLMVQSMPMADGRALLPLMDRVAASFTVDMTAVAPPAQPSLPSAGLGGQERQGGRGGAGPQVVPLTVRPASLEAMLREGGQRAAQRLDARLRWQSAFGDLQGQFSEAFFTFDMGGRPARGAVLVLAGQGTAWLLVDDAGTFPRSHSAFMRQVAGEMAGAGAGATPGGAPRTLALQRVSFGSGTIGLPQGWQVTGAFQGCVEAASAVGYLALGCAEFAAVPGAYPDPRVFHHAYADPATMLKGWLASASSRMGARDIQVLESTPSPSGVPGGQAAYVLVDFVHTSTGRAVPHRGLVMVHVMPTDRQTYTLYKSMVLLHRERFEALMPTMWEAWKSWSVNPEVFRARMDAALASMRETSRIVTGGHAERSRVSDSTQRAFGQYIRGTATVEDVLTRERGEGDARAADRIVAADPTRYRIVPLP